MQNLQFINIYIRIKCFEISKKKLIYKLKRDLNDQIINQQYRLNLRTLNNNVIYA